MIETLKELLESLEQKDSYRLFRYMREDYKEKRCYARIPVEKKNGGIRILQAPDRKLKALQRKLLRFFQDTEISPCAAAYVKGRTLLEHARIHTDSKVVLKLDIKDFFGSITFRQVFRAVDAALELSPLAGPDQEEASGEYYNRKMSWFIAKVCTLNGSLPQGAPSSPMLSNMVFFPLDQSISSYCSVHDIRYTRYSDDMFFSGDFHKDAVIIFIRKLLKKNGFVLNEDKIVAAGKGRQQKITGVVVNQKPQADRRYRREIRQDIHYIGKYGLEEHLQRKGLLKNGEDKTVQMVRQLHKIIGRIGFVLQIDPANKEFRDYKEICVNLLHNFPVIWHRTDCPD